MGMIMSQGDRRAGPGWVRDLGSGGQSWLCHVRRAILGGLLDTAVPALLHL